MGVRVGSGFCDRIAVSVCKKKAFVGLPCIALTCDELESEGCVGNVKRHWDFINCPQIMLLFTFDTRVWIKPKVGAMSFFCNIPTHHKDDNHNIIITLMMITTMTMMMMIIIVRTIRIMMMITIMMIITVRRRIILTIIMIITTTTITFILTWQMGGVRDNFFHLVIMLNSKPSTSNFNTSIYTHFSFCHEKDL